MQPDPPLGPAALDVLRELESLAGEYPEAPATVLVWHLALRWIPGRLKRPKWWQR